MAPAWTLLISLAIGVCVARRAKLAANPYPSEPIDVELAQDPDFDPYSREDEDEDVYYEDDEEYAEDDPDREIAARDSADREIAARDSNSTDEGSSDSFFCQHDNLEDRWSCYNRLRGTLRPTVPGTILAGISNLFSAIFVLFFSWLGFLVLFVSVHSVRCP